MKISYLIRRLLALTLLFAVSLALIACSQKASKPASQSKESSSSPSATAKPDRTFRIAYLRLGWAGIEAIDELKLLEKAGWKIEWQRIDQISALANAFNAGQADLIDMSVIIAGQMFERGIDLRVFGTAVGTLGSIVVRQDSTIQKVEDLKGRKLAGVPGGTTSQDINALVRKIYKIDLFKDTQFVQAASPTEVANLLINGSVEAALIWEPVTSRLTQAGAARILATQQDLWKSAMGTEKTQVHVVYLTTSQIAKQYPQLLKDINSAQKQIAELWSRGDSQIIEAFSRVTQLPPDVVATALKRTKPLYGLTSEHKETIAQQLKFNRENGVLLQSDIWADPEKVMKSNFFWSE